MNDVLVDILCSDFTKTYTVSFYFYVVCHFKNEKCNITPIAKMDCAQLSTRLYQVCINGYSLGKEINTLEHIKEQFFPLGEVEL